MVDNFGMMDNAYFTSKSDIIKWINNVLKLNITKIEQACTGAIYCQLLDSIFIGKVKMNKVNWKANNENEFLQNLKILQQSLIDCKINKNIDIAKLAKGRYQDNFEILQWFKGFYTNKNPDSSLYDPEKRRNYQNLTYLNDNDFKTCKKRNYNENNINKQYVYKSINKNKENRSLSSEQKYLSFNRLNGFIGNIDLKTKNINPFYNSNFIYNSNKKIFSKKNNLEKNVYSITKFNNFDIINSDISKFEQEKNDEIEEIKKKYEDDIKILNDEKEKNQREIITLKLLLAEVGKEKEFYFSKLRDFEYLLNMKTSCDKISLIEFMKTILYSEKETEVEIDNNGIPKLKFPPLI
jgi:hypothetical protein